MLSIILEIVKDEAPEVISLVTGLVQMIEKQGTVSLAEWVALIASLNVKAKTLAKAQLTAAGIDPTSPQGIAFLALIPE